MSFGTVISTIHFAEEGIPYLFFTMLSSSSVILFLYAILLQLQGFLLNQPFFLLCLFCYLDYLVLGIRKVCSGLFVPRNDWFFCIFQYWTEVFQEYIWVIRDGNFVQTCFYFGLKAGQFAFWKLHLVCI